VDHGRGHRVEEVQADEIESRLVADDPGLVAGLPVLVEDRELDSGEAGVIPGAPDDVCNIQDAAVPEEGLAVAHASDAGHPLHAGRGEPPGLRADERRAAMEHRRSCLPPDGRTHREHSVKQHSQEERHEHAASE
jgi:hypothetical protein